MGGVGRGGGVSVRDDYNKSTSPHCRRNEKHRVPFNYILKFTTLSVFKHGKSQLFWQRKLNSLIQTKSNQIYNLQKRINHSFCLNFLWSITPRIVYAYTYFSSRGKITCTPKFANNLAVCNRRISRSPDGNGISSLIKNCSTLFK